MSTIQKRNMTMMGLAFVGLLLTAQLFIVGGMDVSAMTFSAPDLATQLGVSAAVATKLLDYANSWYLAVLLAAATGGWGAGLVAIAKSMAIRYGKKAAAAW